MAPIIRLKAIQAKQGDDINDIEFEDSDGVWWKIDFKSIDIIAREAGIGGGPEVA